MGYRIQSTGEYIASDFGLREHFKNYAKVPSPITPEWLSTYGVDPVLEGPQATGGTVYQYSQFDGIEQIDGMWFTKYVLGPIFTDTPQATAAEQEAEYKARKDSEQATGARASRDKMLTDCDWVVVKALESGQVIPAEWVSYRQELRDLPSQTGFPWNINWPSKP